MLGEYTEWLKIINYSSSKQKDYPMLVKRLQDYVKTTTGKLRLNQITRDDVSQYIMFIETTTDGYTSKQYSPRYVNTHIQAIINFNFYRSEKGLTTIPIQHIQKKKIEDKPKHILSKKDIERLFEMTKGKNKYKIRDRAILTLYYGLGLRRSEGEQLQVKDIDFRAGYVYVRKAKGNKERIVPMSGTVQTNLKEYITHSRPMFTHGKYVRGLMVSNVGEALTGQGMLERLRGLIDKSGKSSLIENRHLINLHTLRHTISTHLSEAGVDLLQISCFLGHKSIDTTQLYTHITDENIEAI